jgi:hypothetical protein
LPDVITGDPERCELMFQGGNARFFRATTLQQLKESNSLEERGSTSIL